MIKINRTSIERIELEYGTKQSRDVWEFLQKNGYHVTYSGPKRISATRVDMTKFVIIAEREVQQVDHPERYRDELPEPPETFEV